MTEPILMAALLFGAAGAATATTALMSAFALGRSRIFADGDYLPDEDDGISVSEATRKYQSIVQLIASGLVAMALAAALVSQAGRREQLWYRQAPPTRTAEWLHCLERCDAMVAHSFQGQTKSSQAEASDGLRYCADRCASLLMERPGVDAGHDQRSRVDEVQ